MTSKKLQSLKSALEQKGDLPSNLVTILSRFYEKMLNDTMLSFFFQGKNIPHIVNQQRDLLMMVMGIGQYGGKPVNQAHLEIAPILKGHFYRRLVLLEETLNEFKLSPQAIKEWVGFEKQFEKVIVK